MQQTNRGESQQRLVREDEKSNSAAFPIACSLNEVGLARRLESLRSDLFAAAEERQELKHGYTFRFPGAGDWGAKIADFVATERQCCTFFRFELTFEPNLGPIWLKLTGPDGVKEFIEAMMAAEYGD
jgi:hypothetical protein